MGDHPRYFSVWQKYLANWANLLTKPEFQKPSIDHSYLHVSGVPSAVKVNTPQIANPNPIDLQSEEMLLEMLERLEPPRDVREKEKKKKTKK